MADEQTQTLLQQLSDICYRKALINSKIKVNTENRGDLPERVTQMKRILTKGITQVDNKLLTQREIDNMLSF